MKKRIAMTNRFTIFFTAATLISAVARTVAADPLTVTYDTVDAAEVVHRDGCAGGCFIHTVVVVRGIPRGQSTPVSQPFDFGDKSDMALHCQRLAVLAMSKPGKFQFVIGSDTNPNGSSVGHGLCQLTLVSP
ncbi:MAG TPA: hypothetical protein VHW23_33625 [Kofleriaceae bacterium]|jgi:hypothetical protein|nr:hypothetical protein [Kofleriaceae bacterium]